MTGPAPDCLTNSHSTDADGTTAATLTSANVNLGGTLNGDSVTVTGGTGVYASPNVGTGIGVTLSTVSLGGAKAADYVVAPGALPFFEPPLA